MTTMEKSKNKIILALVLVLVITHEIRCEKNTEENSPKIDEKKTTIISREPKTINTNEPADFQDIHSETHDLSEEGTQSTGNAKGKNGESLPDPEKFIGGSRKPPTAQDILREKMIGLIFHGKPEPLGPRPNAIEANRRYFWNQPPTRNKFETDRRWHVPPNGPKEILKPVAFVPRPHNVDFSNRLDSSASRPHELFRGPPLPHLTTINFRPEYNQNYRIDRRPNVRPHKRFPPQDADRESSYHKEVISNNVGPDFGPVTYEELDNYANSHKNYDHHDLNKRPFKPLSVPVKPIFHSSKPAKHPMQTFVYPDINMQDHVEAPKFDNFPTNDHETCQKYTDDICLDIDNYPHQEILKSLSSDPTRSRTLIAEVRDQSADDLVDGISSAQEERYDYSHYYGNRRDDSGNHRDFAEDGGYLCPSEVKYARPKRARNSKGEWKFIVNMEKYSQTIRMEKCLNAGGSCSYVSHHYRATCNQIHNYQRLLSWEKEKGLHMDIFKVPSCCSCHIEGYAYVFPPLNNAAENEHYSGSERIDRVAPIEPHKVEEINRKAPPYSPVNYPNLPLTPENRNNEGRKRSRSRERSTTTPKRINTHRRAYSTREGSVKRSNDPEHRVNYDYHPIIDFFEAT